MDPASVARTHVHLSKQRELAALQESAAEVRPELHLHPHSRPRVWAPSEPVHCLVSLFLQIEQEIMQLEQEMENESAAITKSTSDLKNMQRQIARAAERCET